jgi:hypothetical protein
MITRGFANFRVFVVWLIGLGLSVTILALFHSLFVVFITNTLGWGKYVVRFFHLLYYALAGLALVAYFIFAGDYLARSVKKGLLLRNTLRVLGVQLLIVGVIQTGLVGYGYFRADWINFILILLEGFSGAFMLFLVNRRKKQSQAIKI